MINDFSYISFFYSRETSAKEAGSECNISRNIENTRRRVFSHDFSEKRVFRKIPKIISFNVNICELMVVGAKLSAIYRGILITM